MTKTCSVQALLEGRSAPLRFETAQQQSGLPLDLFLRAAKSLARDRVGLLHKGLLFPKTMLEFCSVRILEKVSGQVVCLSEAGEEAFMTPRSARLVLAGDTVEVALISAKSPEGAREAVPVRLKQRASNLAIGRVQQDLVGLEWVQERRTDPVRLPIMGDWPVGAIVEVQIQPFGFLQARSTAQVVQMLGMPQDPGIESALAARLWKLPADFPSSVEEMASALTMPSLDAHEDWTDKAFTTIDGESTKDFDDAVYAQKTPTGYALYVAIASVADIVSKGSVIDQEAFARGSSMYLPHGVRPMLPSVLSNGLCSLNPGQLRPVMGCVMQISEEGEVVDYRFTNAKIVSQARLTYTQVDAMLEGDSLDNASVEASLLAAYRATMLLKKRAARMTMTSGNTKLVLNTHGKLDALVPEDRGPSSFLVEEAMIATNHLAAVFFAGLDLQVPYRNQRPVSQPVEEMARAGLVRCGVEPALLARDVVSQVLAESSTHALQDERSQILKALKPAVYEGVSLGHFSLGTPAYMHFTSPIRRYADLLAHRSMMACLKGTPRAQTLAHIAQCQEQSKRAHSAEQEARKLLVAEYAHRLMGQSLQGYATDVSNKGIWCAVQGLDVFMPSKTLELLGWRWSETQWILEEEVWAQGQSRSVVIVGVDMAMRRVDLRPQTVS